MFYRYFACFNLRNNVIPIISAHQTFGSGSGITFKIMKKLIYRFILVFLCVFLFQAGHILAEESNIQIIFSSDSEPFVQAVTGFKEIVKQNKPDTRFIESNLKDSDHAAVMAKAEQAKPSIVYTVGSEATKLAKNKLKDTQIVFSMVLDARKYADTNATGVSTDMTAEMKLRGIRKIMPRTKTIGVIYSEGSEANYLELTSEAGNYGFKIVGKKISEDSDFPVALKGLSGQIDCFLMIPDAKVFFSQSVKYLLLDSLKNSYPVIGLSSFYTKAGALSSFECDYKAMGRQAGEIAIRILNGEKASGIKAERPRRIKYSINTIVSDRMQINIPPQALEEASEIFN